MNFKNFIADIIDTVKYATVTNIQMRNDMKGIRVISFALTVISLIMSCMNFIHRQYEMLAATMLLTLALACIYVLSRMTKKHNLVSLLFFSAISMTIIYFTLSGGNDGFAILWSLLFLPFSMLLNGFGYGLFMGFFFEIFFIIIFWTPLNNFLYSHYSQTFILRFPMLYTAFFVLSVFAKYFMVKTEIAEHKALFANEAKSEFLSRVSHELRTPLNVILSMAKLGLSDKKLMESRNRFEKIVSSSSHLSDIVNDVLEMSRMESGKIEIKREPVYLKELAGECLEFFELHAKENEIILMSSIDAALPETLIGDIFRIRQIIINLLSNAVKFTVKGKVSLDIQLTERVENQCIVLFTVTDTGIGMSDEFLSKIFTPFEQEDSYLSKRYEGSGLGLSISYNLVELMGGKMNVDSILGTGSRFTFSIPFDITVVREKDVKKPARVETGSLHGKRILLVDDIEINRIIICELFTDTGVLLDEADDGEEAFKKYMDSAPGYYNCIFMDIQMPKMDGYAATGAIRTSGRADHGIPVIAMTANALKEDIDSAFAAGMNDHIAKPIDFNDCLNKAVRWCG